MEAVEKTYDKEQMKRVIFSVMEKTKNIQTQTMKRFYQELVSLSEIIDKLHYDIQATQSHQLNGQHIPSATDELDAVIGATEQATATIMDSCDSIQTAIEPIEDAAVKGEVTNQVMNIYEACSFQDITGQRINKVVKTLTQIEGSVEKLKELFGPLDEIQQIDTRSEDDKLMNGPQLDGEGMSQDDIDKLLAEFD